MELEEIAELQKMVTAAAEVVENKLADSLKEAIESINTKVDASVVASTDLQAKAKIAFEALPNMIKEHVEGTLSENIKSIGEELSKQFEGKVKAMIGAGGGNSAGGGSMGLRDLLAESDKIIGVINAWKQPTTDQAMMGQMNLIFRWHGLLSKLEKGGGSGEDITKAIADTFTTQKPE